MNPLVQAFSDLDPQDQRDMVQQYLGGKLFGVIGAANGTPEEINAGMAVIQNVRESRLLAAMPADTQKKTLSLCDDAEDLLNTPDE